MLAAGKCAARQFQRGAMLTCILSRSMDANCTGFVAEPCSDLPDSCKGDRSQVKCYRRAFIDVSKCEHNPSYGNYTLYQRVGDRPTPPPDTKAWKQQGGIRCNGTKNDLESPLGSSAGHMTKAACQEACKGLPACGGIVVGTEDAQALLDW